MGALASIAQEATRQKPLNSHRIESMILPIRTSFLFHVSHAMLWYAMVCYAMSCYAVPS